MVEVAVRNAGSSDGVPRCVGLTEVSSGCWLQLILSRSAVHTGASSTNSMYCHLTAPEACSQSAILLIKQPFRDQRTQISRRPQIRKRCKVHLYIQSAEVLLEQQNEYVHVLLAKHGWHATLNSGALFLEPRPPLPKQH